jgi:hypothetical protein
VTTVPPGATTTKTLLESINAVYPFRAAFNGNVSYALAFVKGRKNSAQEVFQSNGQPAVLTTNYKTLTTNFLVTGNSELNGNTTIAGNLFVTGAIANLTVAGTSTLNGTTTIAGDLSVTKKIYFRDSSDTTSTYDKQWAWSIDDGNACLWGGGSGSARNARLTVNSAGNFGIGGAPSTVRLNVIGNTAIEGTLSITGTNGNVGIGAAPETGANAKKLKVAGDAEIAGNLSVTGGTSNNLTVAGTSTLNGNTTIAGRLHVAGTQSYNIEVFGTATSANSTAGASPYFKINSTFVFVTTTGIIGLNTVILNSDGSVKNRANYNVFEQDTKWNDWATWIRDEANDGDIVLVASFDAVRPVPPSSTASDLLRSIKATSPLETNFNNRVAYALAFVKGQDVSQEIFSTAIGSNPVEARLLISANPLTAKTLSVTGTSTLKGNTAIEGRLSVTENDYSIEVTGASYGSSLPPSLKINGIAISQMTQNSGFNTVILNPNGSYKNNAGHGHAWPSWTTWVNNNAADGDVIVFTSADAVAPIPEAATATRELLRFINAFQPFSSLFTFRVSYALIFVKGYRNSAQEMFGLAAGSNAVLRINYSEIVKATKLTVKGSAAIASSLSVAGTLTVANRIEITHTASNFHSYHALTQKSNNTFMIGGVSDSKAYFYWKGNDGKIYGAEMTGNELTSSNFNNVRII